MPSDTIVRLRSGSDTIDIPVQLTGSGSAAAPAFEKSRQTEGIQILLGGDRDYAFSILSPVTDELVAALSKTRGRSVIVRFPGRRSLRPRLKEYSLPVPKGTSAGTPATPATPVAQTAPATSGPVDLTEGRAGAAPIWILPDGQVSTQPDAAPSGIAARDALVNLARWISARRTSTFEQLFPPSAFHPDVPTRPDRLSAAQAEALLGQIRGALAAAAVGGDEARKDAQNAAEVRSAALTALSHLLATVLKDPGFRAVADAAAAEIFRLIDAEQGDDTARAALRAHAILLLQLRGAALNAADRDRATSLLRALIRQAPPYAELTGPWNFAMCSDYDFHAGECEVLVKTHGFTKIDPPAGTPAPPIRWGDAAYGVYEAPFKTPAGDPIRVFARSASPGDENLEMGVAFFHGVLINRHAQLGSFDLRASTTKVTQQGYKVMMNSQCAGLTTRFAIARLFPDADIYSSWDSTYFRTDQGGDSGKVIASEGLDCFVALLEGMSASEDHAHINERIKKAQWSHQQAYAAKDFVQFVGPAHPLVVARFTDLNASGRADAYDGFLDFYLSDIAEDIKASLTPRDPQVKASQVSGEAAKGLDWASGSMNRVTQYSDLWSGLVGDAELLYAFQSGGFFSKVEPPADVPAGKIAEEVGVLPAVCRYGKTDGDAGFSVDVLFNSNLSHAGKEMKRLLVAADALWRAVDLGYLALEGDLKTPEGQRGMLLLTLAGLLEFPADQNFIDGLWSLALKALRLPDLSRSLVRGCITEQDHDASNYYGSRRGLRQLLDALGKADAVAFEKLKSTDLTVGRAAVLDVS